MIRFIRYSLVAGPSFIVQTGLMVLFVELAGAHYVLGRFGAVAVVHVVNFAVHDRWTFRRRKDDLQERHDALKARLNDLYQAPVPGRFEGIVALTR